MHVSQFNGLGSTSKRSRKRTAIAVGAAAALGVGGYYAGKQAGYWGQSAPAGMVVSQEPYGPPVSAPLVDQPAQRTGDMVNSVASGLSTVIRATQPQPPVMQASVGFEPSFMEKLQEGDIKTMAVVGLTVAAVGYLVWKKKKGGIK